ncbi:MAG TPA: NrfD/PsrC family molybdoenzyme membrane anchor subunit [Gammaproteobacteria bacterium]|nr:NrfD/PsrC family molybdoenzyme membrane anchor subunit [Gammaproteobacteria bacterium]
MQQAPNYREISTGNPRYRILLAVLLTLVLAGLAAAHHMDTEGHRITGMTNQIVWGLPHVFAIFLIVAASGALNVASLSSVFGKRAYQPLARFSALLAIALLIGGLAILMLDLGRPDRLIVAMTHYNFKSIFAWNIFLYIGFMVVVAVYLWLMMERRMQPYSKHAGMLAMIWRLVLTTGTGSIFGFLVAREAYDTAILAPMFVILSFATGLAVLVLLLMLCFRLDGREIDAALIGRLGRLLGIFTAAVFYFVLVFHLTKLYGTQNHGFERFILLDGGIYSWLFWCVQIGIGNLLPLLLVYGRRWQGSGKALATASAAVVAGGFAQLYVIIIGGQAFPLDIFPGYIVESSFHDGMIATYIPSLWELLLGLGGLTAAMLCALLVVRVLPILPDTLRTDAN